MYLQKKRYTKFGLSESVVLSLCECLKDTNCYVYFDNFFTSPTLMAKLLENGIYQALRTLSLTEGAIFFQNRAPSQCLKQLQLEKNRNNNTR